MKNSKKKSPGVVHDFANPVFVKGHLYRLRSPEDFNYSNIDYRHMDNGNIKFFNLLKVVDGEETMELESIDTTGMTMTALDDTGNAYMYCKNSIHTQLGYRFLVNVEGRFEILFLELYDVDMVEPM